MRAIETILRLILDTLFPPVCASCKREGDFLCAECLKSLAKRKISHFSKPGSVSEFKNLRGLIYALDYAKNPQIKAAIKQFKYKFTEELAIPFAKLIVEKIGELEMARGKHLILVPVPLHPKRFRERGFNQAEVIARAVQSKWAQGQCEVQNLLIREKETSQQAKLSKEERHRNLKDAFIMNKKIVHKPESSHLYYIVDDVCTTGSTLENAAKVLSQNGFSRVYGLVIARAFK